MPLGSDNDGIMRDEFVVEQMGNINMIIFVVNHLNYRKIDSIFNPVDW